MKRAEVAQKRRHSEPAAKPAPIEVPRDKPEQIALRIAGPLRERIVAVASRMSDEAQTTTLSDVARRCLIAHLPVLEMEMGLAPAPQGATAAPAPTLQPGGSTGGTERWVAGAKLRAKQASAKT